MSATEDDRWIHLGCVAPTSFVEARLVLHWAAQLIGATGHRLCPHREDDSHTNLLWEPSRLGFVGRRLESGQRVFLDVEALAQGLLSPDGSVAWRSALAGQTLQAALDGLGRALAEAGNALPEAGLSLPEYDLPDHPVGTGAPFPQPDRAALRELAAWYHDAAGLLTEVASRREDASEVRCWPHHFDIATLIGLGGGPAHEEDARSVGVGLTNSPAVS